MYPSGNANADLGYNKHAHVHGLGHGQNQFLTQPPPPPPHFALPTGGPLNPLVTPSLPLAMQGGTGIDWAQLAQQWIHMRDAGVVMPPVAPPPPIIGNVPEFHHPAIALPLPIIVPPTHPHLEEHGEADMDMDEEPERGNGAETPPPPAPVVTQSQWLAASEAAASDPAIVPTNLGPSGVAAMHGKQPWNSWQSAKQANPTAHIPSLLKLNVSNPNEPQQQLQMKMPIQAPQQQQILSHQHQHQQQQQQQNHQQESDASGSASTEIDANKRKMLPAWIREGLEKMEREKQRQLERQQLSGPTDVDGIDVKQVSSKTLTTPDNLLNIANVASDSEDSVGMPGDTLGDPREEQIGNEIMSKDRNSGSSDEEDEDDSEPGQQETLVETKEAPVNGKSYEERLADLMLAVRRTLTEILLETTNEEIAAIAGEALKAHRAKASSAQVIRKSALSSITGNLGLAAYASDSSSESDEDEDSAEGDRPADAIKDADKSVHMSAEDLKARIRRSKRSFERVIDDIENRMAQQKERDEKTLQRHRRRELADSTSERRSPVVNEESLEDHAGYPAHDKLQQFNAGKRPSRKERTTRFSDNKDGKHQSHSSYVHQVVAAAAVSPLSRVVPGAGPQKLKAVPNPATNLLQMPDSVTTMLNAADKALQNATKSSSKAKSSRRRSSSASSSSSSSDSSSSDSDSSSSDSKTSSNRSKRSSRHGHSDRGSSRSKYDRRDRGTKKEQNRDRDRDRERDRRQRHHYSGGSSSSRKSDRRNRDSSRSQEDERGSNSQHRSSSHRSSRSNDHGSSSSSKRQSYRSRSRSKSRSTHHSHSNSKSHTSSSASHSRKRH